jgi:lipoyl(octanoyl) transferase
MPGNLPACRLVIRSPQQMWILDAVDRHGWHLVRRPTGGRAILHTDELTYSVIASLDEPLVAGSVLDSYRRLSTGLAAALQLLGVLVQAEKEYPNTVKTNTGGPVCFDVPSNYEITAGGKKLIGSAQSRRLGGVLQHGSLPLYGDLTRIIHGLSYPDDNARMAAARRLRDRAVTVEMILNRVPEWREVAEFFVQGFRSIFQLDFIEDKPTEAELRRARELAAENMLQINGLTGCSRLLPRIYLIIFENNIIVAKVIKKTS